MLCERQQQLKAYLDKQVSDHKSKFTVDKHHETNEYQSMMRKLTMFDQNQELKASRQIQKMKENQMHLNQALNNRRRQEMKNSMNKTMDRIHLLNQIKEITNKEQIQVSSKNSKNYDTQEHLKNAMQFKSKEKELQRQAKIREEQHTVSEQQSHFDKMQKRYKDIFVAIDEKDKRIQDSYRKLKPG